MSQPHSVHWRTHWAGQLPDSEHLQFKWFAAHHPSCRLRHLPPPHITSPPSALTSITLPSPHPKAKSSNLRWPPAAFGHNHLPHKSAHNSPLLLAHRRHHAPDPAPPRERENSEVCTENSRSPLDLKIQKPNPDLGRTTPPPKTTIILTQNEQLTSPDASPNLSLLDHLIKILQLFILLFSLLITLGLTT